MNTIAARLKHAREVVRDLTQDQLAVLADVSQSTIGNIEAGTRQGKGSLIKIAKALRVSQDWLIDGDGDMELAPAQKPHTTNAQNTVNLSSVTVTFVPYLTKEEAGMFREFLSGEREPSRMEVISVPKGMEDMRAFSLTIDDDVMEPMLPKGVQVVIGAGIDHRSGDAVFISDGTSWLIRRLIVDGDSLYIDSPRTPPKPLTWKIVGPVVSVINPVINLKERMKGRV